MKTVRFFRTALVAISAVALWTCSFVFSYRAGCFENGAGNTSESIDFDAYSIWLMLLALPLSAALIAIRTSGDDKKTLKQGLAFLLLGIPLAGLVSYQIREVGAGQCGWRPHPQKSLSAVSQNKEQGFLNPLHHAPAVSLTNWSSGRQQAALVGALRASHSGAAYRRR
jgi:hypothetical protein